jgi:putative addiction module killer protein
VEARPRRVEKYIREDDTCPFDEWFDSLTDPLGRAQIDKRIARLRLGLLGEWDDVGDGVIELIFKNTGPGYRIYCGQDGSRFGHFAWRRHQAWPTKRHRAGQEMLARL